MIYNASYVAYLTANSTICPDLRNMASDFVASVENAYLCTIERGLQMSTRRGWDCRHQDDSPFILHEDRGRANAPMTYLSDKSMDLI